MTPPNNPPGMAATLGCLRSASGEVTPCSPFAILTQGRHEGLGPYLLRNPKVKLFNSNVKKVSYSEACGRGLAICLEC